MVAKKFQIYGFKNLPQIFFITPQAEGNYQFLLRVGGGGGGIMELPELNLRGYWSQVSINSTIFATFTFSVSVFCFAVSSFSFKHAEVWRLFNLTSKIFTKNYGAQEQLHKTHNLKTMLPYFLTISPTISQVKSLSLSFFPILKSFIPLFY